MNRMLGLYYPVHKYMTLLTFFENFDQLYYSKYFFKKYKILSQAQTTLSDKSNHKKYTIAHYFFK
jgi:hypothetical protein